MEEFKVTGEKVVERIKALVKEGNVRRVILRNADGRILLDVPLNAGVAAAVLLPVWAAIASVIVLATEYTVQVERDAGSGVTKG